MEKIRKAIALIKCALLKGMMFLRLPLSATGRINGQHISFHSAQDSYITEQILYYGMEGYEYELGKFIQAYPFDFNTFIDAGANIGFYSVMVRAAYGARININAIEAFPNNIHYMQMLQKKYPDRI